MYIEIFCTAEMPRYVIGISKQLDQKWASVNDRFSSIGRSNFVFN